MEFTPRSWLAANDLGNVYEAYKDWETAYLLYERAGQLSGIGAAWNNCGAMALALKNYDDAVQAFTRALRASGNSPWAYNNLGTALAHAGRKKEAKIAYEKALEFFPGFDSPKTNLEKLSRYGLAAAPSLELLRKN